MLLNAVNGVMRVIFPLITFPYVTRILGVENLGKYNFAYSIISYMVLLAGLGISTYAIREGARIREEHMRFSRFANEMFSINVVSTAAACILLFVLLAVVPKFTDYRSLLLILSLQLPFLPLGVEWLYAAFEDFLYITVRSVLFQCISLVLLFLFVRDEQALCAYAGISAFSAVGANVMNFLHSRKYCRVRFTGEIPWKRHMKPILILFAMSVTTTIYINSDTTILGFLAGDYRVGIYAVSTRVYSVIKGILAAILVVSIPRLSAVLGQKDQTLFNETATDIYQTLLTGILPAMTGMIALRKEIILIIAGDDYLEAESSLVLLSIALVFCMGAYFWGQGILVPNKKEAVIFKATIVSAVLNVALNFALIPFWKENAAAFTTLLSEGLVFAWCAWEGRNLVTLRGTRRTAGKVVIGCAGIWGVVWGLQQCYLSTLWVTVLSVSCSVVVYVAIEKTLKNEAMLSLFQVFKERLPQNVNRKRGS